MDDNSLKNMSSISDIESIPADILDDEPPHAIPTSSTMSMTGAHLLPSANLFLRGCAFIIDFSILLITIFSICYTLSLININILPSSIVKKILSEKGNSTATNFPFIPITILWIFYTLLLNIIYGTLCEHSKMRGTLGKLIFSLYVIDKVGDRCSYLVAILRNSLKGLFLLPFGFGALTCFINDKKLSLHDMLVGTRVLQKYEKIQPIHVFSFLITFLSLVLVAFVFFKEFKGIDENGIVKQLNELQEASGEDILGLEEIIEEKTPNSPPTNVIENPKPKIEPKKLSLGTLGAFSNNDKVIEINDVIARIIPGKRNENIVKVEVALFEQKLNDGEKQSLNYVASLLDGNSRSNNLIPLMVINIGYKLPSSFCENTTIFSANYRINPAVVDKLATDDSIFNFVDTEREISPSKFFSSSCEALMDGKDFSLRMRNFNNDRSNAGINWVFSFSTPLTKFTSHRGLNYFSTSNSIAIFNKRTSILTIAQYPNKLTSTDIQKIKSSKIVNPRALSTSAEIVVTIPIKLPSVPHFMKADLDKSMEKLRLLLKKEYIRNGYTVQFYNKPTDKIRFPNNYYHIIRYETGQTPMFIDGNLDNNGKISCRISGEKIIQSNRNPFRLTWKIFFNSPVIVVE